MIVDFNEHLKWIYLINFITDSFPVLQFHFDRSSSASGNLSDFKFPPTPIDYSAIIRFLPQTRASQKRSSEYLRLSINFLISWPLNRVRSEIKVLVSDQRLLITGNLDSSKIILIN